MRDQRHDRQRDKEEADSHRLSVADIHRLRPRQHHRPETDSQVERLKAAGCEVVRQEKVSGRSREGRSELQTIMDFLRPGDQIVVVKLDRLGRSTRDVLNLVHELEQRGASLKVLEPGVDTVGPMGRMVLTVLGMVAEMELGSIKERQRAGIERARAEGVYRGRPAKIDHGKIGELRSQGMGATEIAEKVGCKRAMVYKVLKAATESRAS